MSNKEAVGAAFDPERMHRASERAWEGVRIMRERFVPGLRESQANAMADAILRDLGAERLWHPTHVRFGANTLKTFRQASDGDAVLGEDDIWFVDIGPVFDGHEGDVGATFTTGEDADMSACATAARTLFADVGNVWREQALAGPALYAYADDRARQLGWKLNLDIKGHRVSDFPHAIHRGGNLGDFEGRPAPDVWILEIQIAHASKLYGAFHEDLLR